PVARLCGRYYLECLVVRTDRIKELLRILDRHNPVVRAVSDEKRTCDVLRHVLESEFLCNGDALFRRFRPDHPAELKIRLRTRGRGIGIFLPDLLLPLREVPMQRGQRDACGVRLLESAATGRQIAPKSATHGAE